MSINKSILREFQATRNNWVCTKGLPRKVELTVTPSNSPDFKDPINVRNTLNTVLEELANVEDKISYVVYRDNISIIGLFNNIHKCEIANHITTSLNEWTVDQRKLRPAQIYFFASDSIAHHSIDFLTNNIIKTNGWINDIITKVKTVNNFQNDQVRITIDISRQNRNKLLNNEGRILFLDKSCQAYDNIGLKNCNRCQSFDHQTAYCNNPPKCSICCLQHTGNCNQINTQEGQLCAKHCLNALLQGPYFTEFDLATIAKTIDDEERLKMAEGGENRAEYREFIEGPSFNMDDSGYFSIQVIANALKVWSLELIPFKSQNAIAEIARKDPTSQKCYICNYRDHWLTIRKIGNQWFNLNSLLSGPELISDTYLALFLAQLQEEGYSIFIINGELPACKSDQVLSTMRVEQTEKPHAIVEYGDRSSTEAVKGDSFTGEGDEESCIARAIAASLESELEDEQKQLQLLSP
uniref:ubiquitinyl hydrolase 1 n=1 Tax=Tetranychus urticae TaxID=32264 RepID=T1JXD0_TETUR